jgi:hypothetical protein
MYSNQSSEVDEIYLHDISDSNPTSMENYIIDAKTCIDLFNSGKLTHTILSHNKI